MLRFLWGFPNVPGVPDRSCRRQLVRMRGLRQTHRRRTLEAADRAEPRSIRSNSPDPRWRGADTSQARGTARGGLSSVSACGGLSTLNELSPWVSSTVSIPALALAYQKSPADEYRLFPTCIILRRLTPTLGRRTKSMRGSFSGAAGYFETV